ncbi:MAG: hypothetical protein HY829_10575 [Actinobacteria bacterium]|nr:hypothetical protein [Actinomycetota bacterium]
MAARSEVARRRWVLQGLVEAEHEQRMVRCRTGLDVCAGGKALADYVTQELSSGYHTAVEIATRAGFRDPYACATRLSRSGHAPLGRSLLERDYINKLQANR